MEESQLSNFRTANRLFRENKLHDAVREYEKSLAQTELYCIYENLGIALEALGRREEAAKVYESALRLNAKAARAKQFFLQDGAPGPARPLPREEVRPSKKARAPSAGTPQDLPEELKVLYAHKCPFEDRLRASYEQSSLSREPDNFVLYRIIGNDLFPRHAKGQSRQNVRFILENEPPLENCEKRWVLNRIFDSAERQAIIDLLEEHGQTYLEIPFEAEAFAQIRWDYASLPEPGFLSSATFHTLEPLELQQERVITATYRLKNLYLMNNNGARNTALEDGRGRAKWVLPWDGNCFVTRSGWEAIQSAVRSAPHLPYFAVPMERITDNAELLREEFTPCPVEEPQLLFRKDTDERFGENHPYGRRPKVELFWRLGIPGKWDRWKDDPWEQPRSALSQNQGAWGVGGWVARLASGKAHLEASTLQSFKNRGRERQKAIRAAINHVTTQVTAHPDPLGLTCYRLETIEALRTEYEQAHPSKRSELLQTLLKNATEALTRQPESPVDKPEPGPSGNLQDYYHPAPYWWPNPNTKDGLPYVRKDGERIPGTRLYEPESHRYDRTRLQRLFDDSTTLALAALVTGDQTYSMHAAKWLDRWFINPATRMNPHLTYAQVRRGHNKDLGAQSGVIEMKDLYYLLDAVRLLGHIGTLSEEQHLQLKRWFQDYLNWLLTSEQGTKEARSRNNHGTYYDLQVAAIAAYLDDSDTLFAALARAEERIPLQIAPDGFQREEMERTNTAHYCCFTLQGWLNLLNLASRFDGTFPARAAEPRHPLRMAVQWLLAHQGSPWPHTQIEPFDDQRFFPIKGIAQALALTDQTKKPFYSSGPQSFDPHDGIQPYWALSLLSVAPGDSGVSLVRAKTTVSTASPKPVVIFPHRGARGSSVSPSGATISLLELARGLKAHGVTPIIVLFRDETHGGVEPATKKSLHPDSDDASSFDFPEKTYTPISETTGAWKILGEKYGVRCVTFEVPYLGKGMPTYENQRRFVASYAEAWRNLCISLDASIIHSNDASTHGTVGVTLENLKGVRWVWHERGLWKHKYFDAMARRADAIITISQFVKQQAPEMIADRVCVIPNPIEASCSLSKEDARSQLLRKLALDKDSTVIGIMGNSNSRKRWDVFVEVVREFSQTAPLNDNVFFAVFGDGIEPVKELIAKHGDASWIKQIILVGYTQDAEIMLRGLNCVVQTAELEPLGRVVIEALQLETPVIATNSGGHEEILRQYSKDCLFDIERPADGAALLRKCLSSPEHYQSIAKKLGTQLKKTYSIDHHAAEVAKIYASMGSVNLEPIIKT